MGAAEKLELPEKKGKESESGEEKGAGLRWRW